MTALLRISESMVREPLRAALTNRQQVRAANGAGTASAVLLPLFAGEDAVRVWLVRRALGMRKHSGQVAFPGGKRDPEDASLLDTALRETEEEIGIAPSSVDVLGVLDDLVTVTGYVITPYVGWITDRVVPMPNPAEVARVFSAPLHRFVGASGTPTNLLARVGFSIEGELVWGATAVVARRLGAIVRRIVEP